MNLYQYEGPVMQFENCVNQKWKASTYASTPSKAKSNLAYRYKRENGLMANARITLPGKLILA